MGLENLHTTAADLRPLNVYQRMLASNRLENILELQVPSVLAGLLPRLTLSPMPTIVLSYNYQFGNASPTGSFSPASLVIRHECTTLYPRGYIISLPLSPPPGETCCFTGDTGRNGQTGVNHGGNKEDMTLRKPTCMTTAPVGSPSPTSVASLPSGGAISFLQGLACAVLEKFCPGTTLETLVSRCLPAVDIPFGVSNMNPKQRMFDTLYVDDTVRITRGCQGEIGIFTKCDLKKEKNRTSD